MNIEKGKEGWFASLSLKHGSHGTAEQGVCVMEAVAYFAGERHSDHPQCASRVITKFAMRLNDRWDDERRQQLKPFIPRIAGTAASDEIERTRAFMCADWAVRECLPVVLELRPVELRPGLVDWAPKLRALPEIVDAATALGGKEMARQARAAAAYAARQKIDSSALGLLERLIRVTE